MENVSPVRLIYIPCRYFITQRVLLRGAF